METTKKLDSYLSELAHKEDTEEKSEPNGAGMAKTELFHLANTSKQLHDMLEEDYPLDDWMEAKITKAADYIRSVHQYVSYDKTEEGEEGGDDKQDGHVTVYIATSSKTLRSDAE